MFIYTVLLYIHTTWIYQQRVLIMQNQTMFNHEPTFQLQTNLRNTRRWVAHVSSLTTLKSSHRLVLNVKPTEALSSFDIIERLLFAKTCETIFSDASLPLHQIRMLKQMAMFSGTEIVFVADMSDFNANQSIELEKA